MIEAAEHELFSSSNSDSYGIYFAVRFSSFKKCRIIFIGWGYNSFSKNVIVPQKDEDAVFHLRFPYGYAFIVSDRFYRPTQFVAAFFCFCRLHRFAIHIVCISFCCLTEKIDVRLMISKCYLVLEYVLLCTLWKRYTPGPWLEPTFHNEQACTFARTKSQQNEQTRAILLANTETMW